MLSNDQSVKNFEIVNQDLIYSRNRILDIIYDMSKNCLDVTSFNYDKELKGIFDSYASDLEKLKKELLDKSWSNGIKYDSLDGELKIVHAVNLKIETRMN